ncbi:protein of unknown function [Methylocella tundrae]|uniref:Uncharacterized protein n=1 Tax=Methylocella tundrae TaxID=227605 RepID=A0A4U8YYV8_METTU|nr:protein of unknown function [Methylocella tundrae]
MTVLDSVKIDDLSLTFGLWTRITAGIRRPAGEIVCVPRLQSAIVPFRNRRLLVAPP